MKKLIFAFLLSAFSFFAAANPLDEPYWPVTTVAGAGSNPNIYVRWQAATPSENAIHHYDVEWWPTEFPGWSFTSSIPATGNLEYLIQGYAEANRYYAMQITAYDAYDDVVASTGVFTFIGKSNATHQNPAGLWYE